MPARFEICECGKHGRIILESGFNASQICFKEWGLSVVEAGLKFEVFWKDDAEKLTQEISASILPTTLDEVEPRLLYSADIFNKMAIDNPEARAWPEGVIHDLLFTQHKAEDVPPDFLEQIRIKLQHLKLK